MDPALKELTKLEKATDPNGKGPSINQSLDSLLENLYNAKSSFLAGRFGEDSLKQLAFLVEAKKKEIDERQKEIYNILSRLGKALDKVPKSQLTTYYWLTLFHRSFRLPYRRFQTSSRLHRQSPHLNEL